MYELNTFPKYFAFFKIILIFLLRCPETGAEMHKLKPVAGFQLFDRHFQYC